MNVRFGSKANVREWRMSTKVIRNVGLTDSNGGLYENAQINVPYYRLARIDYKCLNMGGSTWWGGMVVEAITMLQAFSMPRCSTLVEANNPLLVNHNCQKRRQRL